MHGFHFLVMMVVGNAIRDTQCGFKVRRTASCAADTGAGALAASQPACVRACTPPTHPPAGPLYTRPTPAQLLTRSAARLIVPNQRLQRFAFDVELIYLAQRLRVPLGEVQVRGDVHGEGRGGGGGPSALCLFPPAVPQWVRLAAHTRVISRPTGCACARACAPPLPRQVNWTEIPGSKMRVMNMVHMALELGAIKTGYTSECGVGGGCEADWGQAADVTCDVCGPRQPLHRPPSSTASPTCPGGLWAVRTPEVVDKKL